MQEISSMQNSILSLYILVIFPAIITWLWHLLDIAMIRMTIGRFMEPYEKSKPCACILLPQGKYSSGKLIFYSLIASTIMICFFPDNTIVLAVLYALYGCSFAKRAFDLLEVAEFKQATPEDKAWLYFTTKHYLHRAWPYSKIYTEWLCLSISFYFTLAALSIVFTFAILISAYSYLINYIATCPATLLLPAIICFAVAWLILRLQAVFW